MLSFPIIDTHLHLWEPKRLRYPWLDGSETLNRPFALKEFHQASAGVPIEKIVFLQCDCISEQYQQEIAFVEACAQEEPRLQGIVPWGPVDQGEAAEPEIAELASNPRIKGVRRLLQSEPDLGFCLEAKFLRGLNLLGQYDLHFELCVTHRQIPTCIEIVRRCPNVRFILDHIGKPDIREGLLEPWRKDIQTLATLPNVWCKVSGMVTETDLQNWMPNDLRPYAEHVFASFGFDRVMFGSDWPVATLACDYARWVETLGELVSDCSEEEQRKLFYRNAADFYRLD